MVNTNFHKHLKVLHLVLYLKFFFKIYIVSYFIIMIQLIQNLRKMG